VPAAAAAALGDVYARAQAALGRAGAARSSGDGQGRPAAAGDGGSPGDGGGGRERGDAGDREEREDEGSRRTGGGGAAAAARGVLEAARDGQAVPRLCRCLEDCADDPGVGAAAGPCTGPGMAPSGAVMGRKQTAQAGCAQVERSETAVML
jgi:hypothetical protein